MIHKGLPGFRDFPPGDLALRTHIFGVWRQVAERYGFEEYDGPPLEPLELYTSKSGDEIVGQLYEFTDKGERRVALRPEMTPTLARMVGAHASALKKPIRWFSIPQLFRYERQQRGRLREHFQLNCDLIGETGPLADAEIIALAIDIMRGFGLGPGDVRVRISDRRVVTALVEAGGTPPGFVAEAFELLDKHDRVANAQANGFGVKDPGRFGPRGTEHIHELVEVSRLPGTDVMSFVRERLDRESHAGVEALSATMAAIAAQGLGDWLDVDLTIVRGLAYYTGTVFELFDARRSMRAICGGGRYDNLLESVGGTDLPAVGFGMGDVVLGELLKERGLLPVVRPPIEVFVASIGAEDIPDVLALAHQLRDAGVRVEYALGQGAVGKQLNLAGSRGARFAVVIGPDDRARGEVQLKDLARKSQDGVARSAIVAHLSSLLSTVPHG